MTNYKKRQTKNANLLVFIALVIIVFGSIGAVSGIEEDTAYICLKNIDNDSKDFNKVFCSEFPYLDNNIFNDESREKIEMKFNYNLDIWKYGE